ncbi:MAG: hypothetical protein HC820_01090 [Hydrococcus sp. RM1_1_31]|nr:hypothetical protein [Hydrococcus sp. RM1_1_31]
MGEAKRRKKILGEAYGRQETSGQLAKAKRQLASEWATRMTLEKEVKRDLEEDFNFFKTSSLNVGSNILKAPKSRISFFPSHKELEKKAIELGQRIRENPHGVLFAKRFMSLSEWLPDFLKTFAPQTRKILLLDHIKTLRENLLLERNDFRNDFRKALETPEPFFFEPSVFDEG